MIEDFFHVVGEIGEGFLAERGWDAVGGAGEGADDAAEGVGVASVGDGEADGVVEGFGLEVELDGEGDAALTGAVPCAWGGDVVAEVDAIEVDGEHENHLTGVVGVVMGGEIGGAGGNGFGSFDAFGMVVGALG